MLNPYFAFGVPLFLIILYLVFATIRRNKEIHYIGFVLLLIATFMMAFSFQVLQEFWSVESSVHLDYPPSLLWLPLATGGLLALLNLWRGVKRIQSFRENSTIKK